MNKAYEWYSKIPDDRLSEVEIVAYWNDKAILVQVSNEFQYIYNDPQVPDSTPSLANHPSRWLPPHESWHVPKELLI